MFKPLFDRLRSRPAFVLTFDPLTPDEAEQAEEQIRLVSREFDLVCLRDLSAAVVKGTAAGKVALAIKQPRKSFWLWLLPFLRSEKLPYTLFVDADCVGLNRLPPTEELEAYVRSYPGAFPASRSEQLKRLAWDDPAAFDQRLIALRREVGPLPVETLDPTRFFIAWGRIAELNPALVEVGAFVTSSPNRDSLPPVLDFCRRQTRQAVTSAFLPIAEPVNTERWKQMGVQAVLGCRMGLVDKHANPCDLPFWELAREEEESG